MSKASRYAEANTKAIELFPAGFSLKTGNLNSDIVFTVNEYGGLKVGSYNFEQQEALHLRDWLTDTFDEVKGSSPEKGSYFDER